jgi:hypothetical protein
LRTCFCNNSTGLAATQKARRANRSVEQKAADNVKAAATQKARRANRSGVSRRPHTSKVKEAERQEVAYWAVQNGVRG